MFAYDPAILAAVKTPVNSVADVLQVMQTIDALCLDADGLKWFNWLYLQVTSAVETRVASGNFSNPTWLSELDVQFGRLYLRAVSAVLTGAPCPGCWRALFDTRDRIEIARIQFALAGINAHINHDLPEALVATALAANTVPLHGSPEYNDFSALNTTLDALIESAKRTLNVRLLGDELPAVSHLGDLIAAWGTAAAREKAWNNSEVLWHLQGAPALATAFLDSLDGLTTFAERRFWSRCELTDYVDRLPFRATSAAQSYADLRLPVTVLLDNVRSMYNVGAFFRTADGAGVERLLLSGITARPPKKAISKTALGAEERVPWLSADQPSEAVRHLQVAGHEIAAIETSTRAVDLFEWQPRFPVCVLFGHEVDGLTSDLLEQCDTHVRIPMLGLKHSLNVSCAGAIVLYELLRKYKQLHQTSLEYVGKTALQLPEE